MLCSISPATLNSCSSSCVLKSSGLIMCRNLLIIFSFCACSCAYQFCVCTSIEGGIPISHLLFCYKNGIKKSKRKWKSLRLRYWKRKEYKKWKKWTHGCMRTNIYFGLFILKAMVSSWFFHFNSSYDNMIKRANQPVFVCQYLKRITVQNRSRHSKGADIFWELRRNRK